jgi:hypothetical protein
MINLGFIIQLNGQQVQRTEERLNVKNSRIAHDSVSYQSYGIQAGDFTVFQLISNNAGEPGNNSKAESVLAFQIKSGLDQFAIKDNALSEHEAIYIQRCRCQDRGIQKIISGDIKVAMLTNGNWRIEGEVEAIGRLTGKIYLLSVDGEYESAESWGE